MTYSNLRSVCISLHLQYFDLCILTSKPLENDQHLYHYVLHIEKLNWDEKSTY